MIRRAVTEPECHRCKRPIGYNATYWAGFPFHEWCAREWRRAHEKVPNREAV